MAPVAWTAGHLGRRSWWGGRPLATALVVAIAAGGWLAYRARHQPAPQPTGAEVVAYQAAIHPHVVEWGAIEVQGMRPAVGDLQAGEGLPAATIAGQAGHWAGSLREIRGSLRRASPPQGLERAAELFDRALARYLVAAAQFGRAARAQEDERAARIDAGIAAARDGARRYNEASALLQQARRSAGLAPTPDFPDPAES